MNRTKLLQRWNRIGEALFSLGASVLEAQIAWLELLLSKRPSKKAEDTHKIAG